MTAVTALSCLQVVCRARRHSRVGEKFPVLMFPPDDYAEIRGDETRTECAVRNRPKNELAGSLRGCSARSFCHGGEACHAEPAGQCVAVLGRAVDLDGA